MKITVDLRPEVQAELARQAAVHGHPIEAYAASLLEEAAHLPATKPDEPIKWKVETNDRYNKIVSTVISLATGALVLPALFLREFLGVPKEETLAPLLTCAAYTAWLCLSFSVFFGLLYSWFSVKWVKQAWGQTTVLSEHSLEQVMDWCFGFMMLLFVVGIAASIWFFVTVRVRT